MCSGARSSSAKAAMARRACPAWGWATSRRTDLSDWTMSGPSGADDAGDAESLGVADMNGSIPSRGVGAP